MPYTGVSPKEAEIKHNPEVKKSLIERLKEVKGLSKFGMAVAMGRPTEPKK
jgi:hypothetical protein